MLVCMCVTERKRIERIETDTQLMGYQVLFPQNRCPCSVDYGFLEHSYTHWQLVECVPVRV